MYIYTFISLREGNNTTWQGARSGTHVRRRGFGCSLYPGGAEQSERLLRIRERELVLRERELALEERELAVWLGLYPIVTSQYSSTNLYRVSYHI